MFVKVHHTCQVSLANVPGSIRSVWVFVRNRSLSVLINGDF